MEWGLYRCKVGGLSSASSTMSVDPHRKIRRRQYLHWHLRKEHIPQTWEQRPGGVA